MDTNLGHWIYPKKFNPSEWEGFIYRIIDTVTNKEYIGKKSFASRRSKKIKGRTNRVWKIKESNWKTYTSSSETINKLIQTHGKERFVFLIESLHKTKASLTYAEVEKMITEDVLRSKLPNGERKYYNGVIPPIKFLPPHETTDEEAARLFTLIKEKYPNESFLWENGLTDDEKEEFRVKYRIGKNNSTVRNKSIEEYTRWVNENFVGENNPMFGRTGVLSPRFGKSHTEETKKLLSDNMVGKLVGELNPRYKKSPFQYFTDEQLAEYKKKLSERMSGSNNPMFGKPSYYKKTREEIEIWKENIKKATKGIPKSEETKKKMSIARKGIKIKTITCPHCQKTGGINNMSRYHFDNCKSK